MLLVKYLIAPRKDVYIMKVSEVKQILDDINMQDKETNFKIVQPGGKLTLNKLYEEFIDFKNIVSEFIVEQRKFNIKQEKFNANIMSRLDNIVKLNNLKE